MNGKETVRRQLTSGTRPLVELMDRCRLNFGFGAVTSLTPIVETKLRNGEKPLRPLQLAINFLNSNPELVLVVQVPISFPNQQYALCWKLCTLETSTPPEIFRDLQEETDKLLSTELEHDIISDIRAAIALVNQERFCHLLHKSTGQDLSDPVADVLDISDDEVDPAEVDVEQKSESDDSDASRFYTCRTCGYALFERPEITHYNPSSACTSIFLSEAPDFIALSSEDQEGKVYCPKCHARVGSWSWVGSRCSCSEWVVPSFQFVRSKIDEKNRRP